MRRVSAITPLTAQVEDTHYKTPPAAFNTELWTSIAHLRAEVADGFAIALMLAIPSVLLFFQCQW